MVEQATNDLNKTLTDKDAIILFEYHWKHGNRNLLCKALAEANMGFDKASMYGHKYSYTEQIRIAIDNSDFKGLNAIFKKLGSNIDDILYPTIISRVAISVANSCAKESIETLVLLLNNSKVVRNMAGQLLEILAQINCLEGVYLLLHRVKPNSSDNLVSLKDINIALSSVARKSIDSVEDYTRVIESLLFQTTSGDTVKIFLELSDDLDKNISKLFIDKIKG